MNELELTGLSQTHIVKLDALRCGVHYRAVTSLLAMADAAAHEGIALGVRSGFRDFNTQLQIWNAKWRGERPLLSATGIPLDAQALSADERMEAILTWSALPGGSRHHWGSDLDVVDTAAVAPNYSVQLVATEYADGGPFERLNRWLNAHARQFGFFRPYRLDRGGVQPEPWHISYAPVSTPALESLSLTHLRQTISSAAIEGKDEILARLPEIYTRYMLAVDSPA